jgi:hypothetical protein
VMMYSSIVSRDSAQIGFMLCSAQWIGREGL